MSLNIKEMKSSGGSSNRAEPLEPGSYPARVVQIIDLGVQASPPNSAYPKPPQHMISVTYELCDEFLKDEAGEDLKDKPRWVSEDFNLMPLDKDLATSTKRYKALDPNDTCDGDITRLIGCCGMVSIVQRKSRDGLKVYNNVAGVAPVRAKAAATMPELVNGGKVFVLSEPDLDVFNSLPDFLKEKIKGNLKYQGSPLQRLLEGGQAPIKGAATTVVAETQDDDDSWG